MSTAVAELPVPEALTFKPFSELPTDESLLADHAKLADQIKADKDVPDDGGEMSLAKLAKLAKQQVEPEVKIVEAPKPTEKPDDKAGKAVLTKDITDETTDDELAKISEATSKELPKEFRKHVAQHNWEVREERRQRKAVEIERTKVEIERTKLADEVKKLRDTAPDGNAAQSVQKRLEAAEAKLAEKETLLGGYNYRETEEFKNEIAIPMAKITEEFKEFSDGYDVPAEELIALTELKGRTQDEKFEELTSGWAKRKSDKLADLLDRHSAISSKEKMVISNGKQSFDAFIAQKREQHDQELAKLASDHAAAVPKVWEDSILKAAPFLKDVEGDADWNERLSSTRDFTKVATREWFLTQPVAEQVRLTAQAAAFPMVLRYFSAELAAQRAENAKLKKHNGELKAATPGAGGDVALNDAQKVEETPAGAWNPFKK